MRNFNAIQQLALVAVLVLGAFAVQAEESPRRFVMCRNGKAVRSIWVEKDLRDQAGWVTIYSKGGKGEIVGEGLNPNSCEDVLDRVQKTLEANSWKCRNISNGQIHRGTAGL